MNPALVLVAVVAVTALIAWLLRRNDGRIRTVDEDVTSAEQHNLGVDASRWALVEFTAPSCHPCVQARQVLDAVAAESDDVDVVAVDVAEHHAVARAHGVLRAPTTLLVAPGGHIHARVSGVPRAEDLRALLAEKRTAPAAPSQLTSS